MQWTTVSATIHKIIHEEMHMKKLVCHCASHDLSEHQKAECVRMNLQRNHKTT